MADNQLTERDKYIRRLFFHEWAMRQKNVTVASGQTVAVSPIAG